MKYLVCLVNQGIPEREEFYNMEDGTNPYEKFLFVHVNDEQEIKLHLCNWEIECFNSLYIVLKDNEFSLKSKRTAFSRKYKADGVVDMINHIGQIEIANMGDEDIVQMPDIYRFRVYNQTEENRIRFEYADYVTADDEHDAYMKELDHDHMHTSGAFVYIKDNEAYLMGMEKTQQWKMKVKWGCALLERILRSYDLDEETYEDLKAD